MYNPLSDMNLGFGSGFSLNLSSCDTRSGKLLLSSGEEYHIDSRPLTVKQKKLKNFILKKTDENHCTIIHKSGLVKLLSLHKEVYVPSRITAPDGRGLTLTWDSVYTPARLSKVTDDDGTVLYTVTYPNDMLATTKFSVLPDDADSGYSMVFRFNNDHLFSVTSNYRLISGLTIPTGRKEKVDYYTDTGMQFPEIAGLPDLPCVYRHTLVHGGGQPASITLWEWTQRNYLGKDAGLNQWQPDSDMMLNVLLPDYQYGSTARLMDTDGNTVLSTVTRRYNSYHLQVSETTLRSGKTYLKATEYHARPGASFEEQPAQFALPLIQTESWDDGSGVAPRMRVTQTWFDEAGNPQRQEAPDGTVTEYVYYPAEGESDACPADPYGFTCWLKSKTATPRQIYGDEPVSVSVNT
ncbi:hypothetical protein XS74_25075 [Salmonella enterica subsp. enterica]|nr:hypothetical protein [Salmonella enterica subsp. enterica]